MTRFPGYSRCDNLRSWYSTGNPTSSNTGKQTYTSTFTRTFNLLLLCSYVSLRSVFAQSIDCTNIGFELGTTQGWTLSTGRVLDKNAQTVFYDEVPGTFDNGHLITKLSDGNDPNIKQTPIPMVAPGSKYSIRIGNAKGGARFDRIRATMLVTPDNSLFQYKFAVVLQDPNHAVFQQPAFSLRITNANGQPAGCGYYEVTAAKKIDGFMDQGALRYRNWTTGAIDLKQYVGQTLTIEVTTNDCTESGHYGYAYFDAQCLKSEVIASSPCPSPGSDLTLTAPDGFESYLWNTGQTTRAIIVKPKEADRYSVKVRPFSSLNNACDFNIDYTVPPLQKPYSHTATICEGEGYVVGDTTYRTSGTFTRRVKRIGQPCDSVVVATIQVKPMARHSQRVSICEGEGFIVGDTTYRTAGTFVRRIARDKQHCDSIVTTTITVIPLSRHSQRIVICEGDSLAVGKSVYRTAGTYVDRIPRTAPLCDSIVTTTLAISAYTVELPTLIKLNTGDSIQLKPRIRPAGNYTYQWSPADGLSCTTCPEPWAKPATATTYSLTVSAVDAPCHEYAQVMVEVDLACGIFVPDAFTPNKDPRNPIFELFGGPCAILVNELLIYDRWGEVIYRRTDFPISDRTTGWDGTYNGNPVPPGTYGYQIRYEYGKKQLDQKRGKVVLIR
ncbi:T9SS type B sorting domain-containing protein [Spirosoma validum]|uniref:Gliding motility-associated C-terminal domain-containing protein n=1 Tax=Spirosoma validum TaxID=2771355 RepID=A0A927B0N5_9BACT|nr:T9SS type B sorting domain-containing protein [Spirosoma validum]MBD2753255.1 gliding motility-associated C-terminal domain-containing protein [Spirosoma validum]